MRTRQKTSVILLAGGIGARMEMATPKQFLTLLDKPIALYSYDLFQALPEIDEIIIVCAEQFRPIFDAQQSMKHVAFAKPGKRRQHSVLNGLRKTSSDAALICIHDAARPLVDAGTVKRVLSAAEEWGAAAAGMAADSAATSSAIAAGVCSGTAVSSVPCSEVESSVVAASAQ